MKPNFEVLISQKVIKNYLFFFLYLSSANNLQRIRTTFRILDAVFFPQLIGDTNVSATSSHNDHRMR